MSEYHKQQNAVQIERELKTIQKALPKLLEDDFSNISKNLPRINSALSRIPINSVNECVIKETMNFINQASVNLNEFNMNLESAWKNMDYLIKNANSVALDPEEEQ